MRPEAQERHESTNTKEAADALLEGNGNETNYERNWGLTTLMTEGDVSRFYFCPTNFSHHHFRMREQQQSLSCMLAEQ